MPFVVWVTSRGYNMVASSVVWMLMTPFTAIAILRRRERWRSLRERLGAPPAVAPAGPPRVVIHAVSAGEAMAAGALIGALQSERPDWQVILACGTRDARAVANRLRDRLPTIVSVCYLPWDRRAATHAWLRRLTPAAVIVVEPEIWPNLYLACDRLDVPLFLVNAHVYQRDIAWYRLVYQFMAGVLRVPVWIGAQTDRDRDSLIAIGAPRERIEVTGSLKADAASAGPADEVEALVTSLRGFEGSILIGGSTYAYEEALLLDSFDQLRQPFPSLRLVLAPRYVRRARGVARAAARRGHRVVCGLNAIDSSDSWDVLIVDRIGQLPSLYAGADVAFVGGTVFPRGGHNVLEPARHGVAIVVGPHVDHIRESVDGLRAVGGIVCLPGVTRDRLVHTISGLLASDVERAAVGERARSYYESQTGVAGRCAAVIVQHLTERMRSSRERSSVTSAVLSREYVPTGR